MLLQHPRISLALGQVPSDLARSPILKVSICTVDWKGATIPRTQTPAGIVLSTVASVGSMNSVQQERIGVSAWQDTVRLRILAVVIDMIAMSGRRVDVSCMFGCRSTEGQRLRRCLV